jgi:ABC-2 type transport system permease protein
MRRVITVAIREYEAAVRTKTFVISMVMMPVLMSGGIIAREITERAADTTAKKFAVVDRTGRLFPALLEAAQERNQAGIFEEDEDTGERRQTAPRFVLESVDPGDRDPASVRLELSNRVRAKELFGFVEIDAGIFDGDLNDSEAKLLAYHSDNLMYHDFCNWVTGPVTDAVQAYRFDKRDLPEGDVRWAAQRLSRPKDLGLVSEIGGEIDEAGAERAGARLGVGIVLTLLIFMVIAIGAIPLMNVVLEEKAQSIVEVLLGSVRPFELMLGKLVGSVGVSLTLVIVYMAGGYGVVHYLGYGEHLPGVGLLIWFVVFLSTAVFMFGSLFLAIGAACSDQREAQSALLPVWLIVCLPLFALQVILQDPSSSFSTGLSLFPLATPLLMPLRLAVDPGLPIWQPFLGMLLALATTTLFVFAAGRVFRIGILMQGKGFSFGQVVRWVARG